MDGIDEAGLERLVHAFYARVREDAELGPIFNDAIADWPEHLARLTAFWSSVMLTSGRYKGQPVPAHMKHRSRITPALFDRWLALWGETARELVDHFHQVVVRDAVSLRNLRDRAQPFGPRTEVEQHAHRIVGEQGQLHRRLRSKPLNGSPH